MEKSVQNLHSVSSIQESDNELSIMEQPDELEQLDQLDEELQRSLEERHAVLEQIEAHARMKELEVRSVERHSTDVVSSTSYMEALIHDYARLKCRSGLLQYDHIKTTLKLAKKLKRIAQNMDTIFEEYSESSIRQRIPEVEARLLETAEERDATAAEVEHVDHLYLHSEPEPQPTPSQLTLLMLKDPARLERLDSEMRSARAALERAWFFAPSSSRKPALLNDTE